VSATTGTSAATVNESPVAALSSVLARAVRLHFVPGQEEAFAAALGKTGLSERLLAFADHAYALPLLASACRRAAILAPDPAVAAALDAAYYLCAARRSGLRVALEAIHAALSAGGLPFMLLKGGALELLAPRAPAGRITADLDVLVPRGQMVQAEVLLLAAGFRPRYAAHVAEFRRHSHHAVPYLGPSGVGVVEVHERLEPHGAPVRLAAEPLWERSLVLRQGEREWRVPELSDLALHTCLHYGLMHPYNTVLRRLWDLGVLTSLEAFGAPAAVGDVDWELVERRARHAGGWRVARQSRSELAWLRGEVFREPEWPLFEAPYSGWAAFRRQQAAADTPWDRARGAWHFLFPGPHETAPVREGGSHGSYLLSRFARGAVRWAVRSTERDEGARMSDGSNDGG
jgi:hypothetical protein